jgi:Secretion system C-terminal sorting domain
MKRFLLLSILWAWLGGALSAQNEHVLDALTKGMLSELDKSSLKTGILLQQAPMWVNPFRYDGQAMHDSNYVNPGTFGRLYSQLRAASVSTPVLPKSTVYLDELARLRQHPSDTVPLALLAMQYEYIHKDAFAEKLLNWGSNDKAVDVSWRTASPYRRDTTFAFAALTDAVRGRDLIFQLPSKFIFDNLGWSSITYELDLGDGQGWQLMHPNQCIAVHYLRSGIKDIALRIYDGQHYWQSHTRVTVPELASSERYSDEPDESVDLGGATLNFFFDCEDKKLRKPLIVVEGFGGEATGFTKMFELINFNQTSPTLKDFLDTEGYDLIWIDWGNSNASIQYNAGALQAALEYINTRKHADGSAETNTMIGASMGGLIGKYCLLSMHNVQGIDSEVERFFTYDSPLTGANYPLGIQFIIRDLLYLSDAAVGDPNIAAALELLDGPAASQLLRQKAVVNPGGSFALTSASFDAFQTEINALEAIKPLTAITRHIALSNGAGTGTSQESVTGGKVADLLLILDESYLSNSPAWQYDIIINATGYLANAVNTLLYERVIKTVTVTGNIEIIDQVSYSHPAPLNLDDAPGGYSNLALANIEGAISNALKNATAHLTSEFDIPITHFCFIPTVSSLGLPITTNISTPATTGAAARSSVSMNNSVPNSYNSQPEFNQEHVIMDVRIADVIIDELKGSSTYDVLGSTLSSSQIYNFGKRVNNASSNAVSSTPISINQDLTIKSGAQLWINRNDRIAFTSNANNPQNNKPQLFVVTVPGTKCTGTNKVVVKIEEGGKILVGDNSIKNLGHLIFTSGSELHNLSNNGIVFDNNSMFALQQSSLLEMGDNSTLLAKPKTKVLVDESTIHIRNGAVFTLSNGSSLEAKGSSTVHFHEGATLRIEGNAFALIKANARLIFDKGVNVILDQPDSKIRIEGQMIVNGDIKFSGQGYFDFAGGPSQLAMGSGYSNFNLKGFSKTNRFVFLSTPLGVPDNKRLNWSNGLLDVDKNTVGVGTNAGVTFSNMTIKGDGGVSATGLSAKYGGTQTFNRCDFEQLYGGINMENTQSLVVQNCNFIKVGTPIEGINNPYIKVSSTNFNNNYTKGIFWVQGGQALIEDSQFYGGNGAQALFISDVPLVLIDGCYVSGHQDPTIPSNALNGDFATATAAIYAENGIFVIRGTTIESNTVGISSLTIPDQDMQAAGIFLIGSTILSNNMAGIFMRGDATKGLVLADCATFINNGQGIVGNDIALMLDSQNTSTWSEDTDTPNAFVRDNNPKGGTTTDHIRVCYGLKSAAASALMRNNWWATYNPNTNATDFDPAPAPFISLLTVTCDNVAAIGAITPRPATIPDFCPVEGKPGNFGINEPKTDCTIGTKAVTGIYAVTGEEKSVNWQWHEAYYQLKTEPLSELGVDLFRPVADLWQPDLSSYSDNCQQYIATARAIVDGLDDAMGMDTGARPSERKNAALWKSSISLKVAPNPAQESVNIILPFNTVHLTVMDMNGRVVFQQNQPDKWINASVRDWSGGLYVVRAELVDGSFVTTKLAVVK